MRAAVVVIGSDACRVVVAEPTAGGWLRTLADRRVVLGLARTVRRDGALGAGLVELTAETTRRLVELAVRSGAERIDAVVDHRVVDGADGEVLRSQVAPTIGRPLDVLDEAAAAAATTRAVTRRLALRTAPTTVTLEDDVVRVVSPDRAPVTLALDLGSVVPRGTVDPLHPAAAAAIRHRLGSRLATLVGPARDGEASARRAPWPVLAGGRATALGRAVVGRRWGRPAPAVDGLRLPAAAIADLERELHAAGGARRLLLPGIDPADADEVAVAVLTVRAIVERLRGEGVVVTAAGVHEGLLLQALAGGGAGTRRAAPTDRSAPTSASLHAEHVARTLDQLLDHVAHHLDLDARDRDLAVTAARLHDVGACGADTDDEPTSLVGAVAARRAAEELLAGGLPGVPPETLVELACLVRFQTGPPPGTHLLPYSRLSARRRRAVDRAAVLLRLACRIDQPAVGAVTAVHLDVEPGRWCLQLFGRGDLTRQRRAVERDRPLVAAVLGVALDVRAPAVRRDDRPVHVTPV